jgi:hypothetical protein
MSAAGESAPSTNNGKTAIWRASAMIANRSAARKRDLFEIECKSKTTSSCFSPILRGLVRNIQLAMHFKVLCNRTPEHGRGRCVHLRARTGSLAPGTQKTGTLLKSDADLNAIAQNMFNLMLRISLTMDTSSSIRFAPEPSQRRAAFSVCLLMQPTPPGSIRITSTVGRRATRFRSLATSAIGATRTTVRRCRF